MILVQALTFRLMLLIIFSSIVIAPLAAATNRPTYQSINKKIVSHKQVIRFHDELYDQTRKRTVPIEMYVSRELQNKSHLLPVVIINHGYGVKNTEYSFLANTLAKQGYYVISIQHDLETDPALSRTGNLFKKRKPVWDRGVHNILFVIDNLRRKNSNLDLNKVTLIGHSNGGDIAMLFTRFYPERVKQVISFDSLRMPFPRKGVVPILSLRAVDTEADIGVLPNKMDLKKLHMTIIFLKNARHIDLCDRGSKATRQDLSRYVLKFLTENP